MGKSNTCSTNKSEITVVKNEKSESIPTRIPSSWRMCIDYKKLNDDTRKDHFSPFIPRPNS